MTRKVNGIKELRFVLTLGTSLCLVMGATAAMAQTVPGSADVSRVQEKVGKALPSAVKEAPLKVDSKYGLSAPAGAEKITLTLKDVLVEGQTVYSPAELASVYSSKIGSKISLKDVYAIAEQLTAKYRNDGYILTQVVVPPQTISSGVVKLRVVEGKVDQIRVEGDVQGGNLSVIRQYADRLRAKSALNNKDLERALLLINDLPGVTARSVLSPSKSVVGASDLTIIVDRKKYDAQVGLDNYGSRYLGPWEVTGNIAGNSLLGMNEVLGLSLAYAPSNQGLEPELSFGEASAEVPLGAYGTKVGLKYGITRTDPGFRLDQYDVIGNAKYGIGYVSQPIIRSRDLNLSTKVSLENRVTETTSNIDTPRHDTLSVVRAGAHMDWVDTVLNAAVSNFDMEVSRGLSIMGASDKGDTNMSRDAGDPEFTKVTGAISRLERVYNNIALQTTLRGQLANGPLLSAEEFGVGGSDLGRGFDPSEIVGDDGMGASLELQWNQPVTVKWLNDYTVYGFYDVGKVWNDDSITSTTKVESLASTGVGIRATLATGTEAGFMLAKPLTHDVGTQNDRSIRPFVSISQKF